MNRPLTLPVVLATLAIGVCLTLLAPVPPSWAGDPPATAAPSVPEPSPGAAVFEMKYRGLSGPDDPLSYGTYWGFGAPDDGTDQKSPFVLAVKSRGKECTLVYNRYVPKAQWSVVELRDGKPVAFYFDINDDGALSDAEKFPPLASSGSQSGNRYAFVTSDFLLRTDDRRELPFRAILVGNEYGAELSYMWTPGCVLEGQGILAGTPMRLVLFANGFGGSFTEFGQCNIMLLPAEQKLEGYIPHYMRNTLSSLIYHQGTFYRLKLQGTHTRDSAVRVVIERDTTPTGQATIDVAGREGLKAHLTTVWLQGTKDATVQLHLENGQPTLPVGQYKVSYGYVSYGAQSNGEWNVSVKDGPPFDIKAGETTQVSSGQPVLSIKAIEEKDRSADNAKERSTYAKGTEIYLSPQIKGKGGEVYTQFARKNAGNNSYTSVKPHITIRDPDGKTVASADMEYG